MDETAQWADQSSSTLLLQGKAKKSTSSPRCRTRETLAAAAVGDDVRARRGVHAAVDPRGGGAGPAGAAAAGAGGVPAGGGHLVPRVHGVAAAEHPRQPAADGEAGCGEELGRGGGGGRDAVGGGAAVRAGDERVAVRPLRRDPAGAAAVPRLPEGVEAAAQRLHRRRLRGPPLQPRRLRAARVHAHQGPVLPVPPRLPPDARRLRPRRAPRSPGGHGAAAARRRAGSNATGGQVITASLFSFFFLLQICVAETLVAHKNALRCLNMMYHLPILHVDVLQTIANSRVMPHRHCSNLTLTIVLALVDRGF